MLENAAKFRLHALEVFLKVSESAVDFSPFFYGKSSKMV